MSYLHILLTKTTLYIRGKWNSRPEEIQLMIKARQTSLKFFFFFFFFFLSLEIIPVIQCCYNSGVSLTAHLACIVIGLCVRSYRFCVGSFFLGSSLTLYHLTRCFSKVPCLIALYFSMLRSIFSVQI